jgi:sporulation protein YlmC with PRC-barrel domain
MHAAVNTRPLAAADAQAARASVPIEQAARATRVLGRKVIDSSTAVILGRVDELYFHLTSQQIVAIRVRAGLSARWRALLKGKKSRWVVPMRLVQSIGAYAVVVNREKAAPPSASNTPGAARPKAKTTQPLHKPPSGAITLRTLLGNTVVSDAGELLGRLLDVVLSEAGTSMQQLELDTRRIPGRSSKRRLISARISALGDVLLVPAHERPSTLLAAQAASAAPPAEALGEAEAEGSSSTPEWLC